MDHGLWVLVNEMGKTKAANFQTFMCIPEYRVKCQVQTFRNKQGGAGGGGLSMTETSGRAISGPSPFLRAAESSGNLAPSNLVCDR